jgi:microcystin-dependent protein
LPAGQGVVCYEAFPLNGYKETKFKGEGEKEDGMNPFLGEIRALGFNFAPEGWAQCNGQLMEISQNTALFSLLGTTYGGDGIRTFALPDLRKSGIPAGPGISVPYCIALQGIFPARA